MSFRRSSARAALCLISNIHCWLEKGRGGRRRSGGYVCAADNKLLLLLLVALSVRLLCLPWLGGDSSAYWDWELAGAEVVAVELPGRAPR